MSGIISDPKVEKRNKIRSCFTASASKNGEKESESVNKVATSRVRELCRECWVRPLPQLGQSSTKSSTNNHNNQHILTLLGAGPVQDVGLGLFCGSPGSCWNGGGAWSVALARLTTASAICYGSFGRTLQPSTK